MLTERTKNKPKFKKVTQFKCYDIQEADEPESYFHSSSFDTPNLSEATGYNTTPSMQIRKSNIQIQSPANKRLHDAESKMKNSILSCFTIKAQGMLKDLRRERRKLNSCSTSRNSMSWRKFNPFNSIGSEESSPFCRMSCDDNPPTPSELISFSQFQTKSSKLSKKNLRRGRKDRKIENAIQSNLVNGSNKQRVKKSKRKSIESIIVYRGPAAQVYSINTSPSNFQNK